MTAATERRGHPVVQHYIDACRERGVTPAVRLIGRVAREVKSLGEQGFSDDLLILAVDRMLDRGRVDPSMISSFVAEVQLTQRKAVSGDADLERQLTEFVDVHGWPTGWRFVRGTHGGSYHEDDLGFEVPPDGQRRRITKQMALDALRARAATDKAA